MKQRGPRRFVRCELRWEADGVEVQIAEVAPLAGGSAPPMEVSFG